MLACIHFGAHCHNHTEISATFVIFDITSTAYLQVQHYSRTCKFTFCTSPDKLNVLPLEQECERPLCNLLPHVSPPSVALPLHLGFGPHPLRNSQQRPPQQPSKPDHEQLFPSLSKANYISSPQIKQGRERNDACWRNQLCKASWTAWTADCIFSYPDLCPRSEGLRASFRPLCCASLPQSKRPTPLKLTGTKVHTGNRLHLLSVHTTASFFLPPLPSSTNPHMLHSTANHEQ